MNEDTYPTQNFLTPIVIGGRDFLKRKWQGLKLSAPDASDLHDAYLILSALRSISSSNSDELETLRLHIANIELKAKSTFSGLVDNLSIDAATDVLEICSMAEQPDQEFSRQIMSKVESILNEELRYPHKIRNREFALAVLALSRYKMANRGSLKDFVQALKNLEDKDGGWPAAVGGEPSLIATACVVEALRSADRIGASDAVRRGEAYLESRVTEAGWHQLGMPDVTFAQATTLRVLATSSSSKFLEPGVVALRGAANDEGWGADSGFPSTVEMTSVALLALAACDENKFVPYRVAKSHLLDLTSKNQELGAELAKLRENIERQIARDSSAILADRDKWRNVANERGGLIEKLQRELREAERAVYEETRASRSLIDGLAQSAAYSTDVGVDRLSPGNSTVYSLLALSLAFFAAGLIYASANVVTFGFEISTQAYGLLLMLSAILLAPYRNLVKMIPRLDTIGVGLAIAIGVALIFSERLQIELFGFRLSARLIGMLAVEIGSIGFVWLFASFYRLRLFSERVRGAAFRRGPTGPISESVIGYSELENVLPPSLREEIFYVVVSRIADMPEDVGLKFAEDFIDRFKIQRSGKSRFLNWVSDFLKLDPHARRVVAEQIRRQSIPS